MERNIAVHLVLAVFVSGGIVGGVLVYGSTAAGIATVGHQPHQTPPVSAELDGSMLWVGGTIDKVENSTLSIDNYDNTVIAVEIADSAVFRCQPQNGSVSCQEVLWNSVETGEPVCASVYVQEGRVKGNKVFVKAICGAPQPPLQ